MQTQKKSQASPGKIRPQTCTKLAKLAPVIYTENRIEYIDGKNLQLLINELSKYSVSIPTKPRKSMSNEERELDNIRLFKSYVMTLQKKVEINTPSLS